jgi:hypothetical protein
METSKQESKAPTKSLGFMTLDGIQYTRRGIIYPEVLYWRYDDGEYYCLSTENHELGIGGDRSSFSNDKEYFAATEPIPDELCDQGRAAPKTEIKITPKFQIGELVWFKYNTTKTYLPCEITDFTITNEMQVIYDMQAVDSECTFAAVENRLCKVRP